MDEAHALAWLNRKIGWGPRPTQREAWQRLGVDRVIDILVDPASAGVAERPDPFAGLIPEDRDPQTRNLRDGVTRWLAGAVESPRPLETFMEFFWSDYFAVSARSVRPSWLIYDHINLLGAHALGNFAELLRAVTIDPAMLRFLDGATNSAGNPNENFGRELLELYSVGVGEFTEDDVRAASIALTGWTLRRTSPAPTLVDRRHDDTPQTLLGVDGVHDLDTVIDAVVAHPATARRVVAKLGDAILGPGHRVDLTPVAAAFADDLEIRPAVRALLELAVDGGAVASIVEPVPFFVGAIRATQARPGRDALRDYFQGCGQVPLFPPNVGGFPAPHTYLSSSATIARFNLAASLATNASAAATRDLDALAETMGLIDGFAPTTRDALAGLAAGPDRLAAALASPDLLVV